MSAPMRSPLHRVDPERLRHVQGELLAGRDFVDQAAQDDQLRWWHTRALHNAYGIVDGLDVKLRRLDGVATAKVSPGLAIDVFGRELELRERPLLDLPDADEPHLLVLAYTRSAASCAPPPTGVCLGQQVADASVSLRWVPRSRFTVRDGVALASTDDLPESAEDEPPGQPAFRPYRIRPLARPRIGRGATVAGEGAWDPWVEDNEAIGFQIVIDSSAAGFTAVPCYFIEISGDVRGFEIPLTMLMSFAHLTDMRKERFTVRLLTPWLFANREHLITGFRTAGGTQPLVDAHARAFTRQALYQRIPSVVSAARGVVRATELTVTWIGIQHDADPRRHDTDLHIRKEVRR